MDAGAASSLCGQPALPSAPQCASLLTWSSSELLLRSCARGGVGLEQTRRVPGSRTCLCLPLTAAAGLRAPITLHVHVGKQLLGWNLNSLAHAAALCFQRQTLKVHLGMTLRGGKGSRAQLGTPRALKGLLG